MTVIDVGAGTGLVTREAARMVGDPTLVLGIDPCSAMLGRANVPDGVRLDGGSAESIPAADGAADFLTMGYALLHISDLSLAFREFYRVLRPGGRLCLLEITAPEGRCLRALLKLYMRYIIPAVSSLVARGPRMPQLMRYYWDTIESCASPASILEAMVAAGFVDVRHHVEANVFSEYLATKPAIAAVDGCGTAS